MFETTNHIYIYHTIYMYHINKSLLNFDDPYYIITTYIPRNFDVSPYLYDV
jgi:hypothetical protein